MKAKTRRRLEEKFKRKLSRADQRNIGYLANKHKCSVDRVLDGTYWLNEEQKLPNV